MAVFEVLLQVLGEHLAVYLAQYREILSASLDKLNSRWNYDIMLDHEDFIFITDCLDSAGHKMMLIMTGHKPI